MRFTGPLSKVEATGYSRSILAGIFLRVSEVTDTPRAHASPRSYTILGIKIILRIFVVNVFFYLFLHVK